MARVYILKAGGPASIRKVAAHRAATYVRRINAQTRYYARVLPT